MITIKYPNAEQPIGSKIPLWGHQKKMLHRCLCIEKYFNGLEKNKKSISEDAPDTFGIMADKPGTGKTNVAISLVLSDLQKCKNQCNLIVVPQNIYTQWDESIRNFCDLDKVRYKTFTNYSEISKLYAEPNMLKNVDLLLTTSLYYHMICGTINTLNKTCGLKIGRVFFDEIDTLNSMLREPVQSNFTWFISASFKEDKIGCYKLDKLIERTCKCEEAVIDASFNLQPPVTHIYNCKSIFTEMIKDIMPVKKITELNALDFNTNIYRFVTIVPKNEKEFVFYLLRDIEEIFNYSKNNIDNLLKARKQIEESGFFSGQILQFKINSIMTQVRDSQNQIAASKNVKKTIYDRLKQKKICAITLSDLENDEKVISKCCANLYYKGILEKIKKYNCPLCENVLEFPDSFITEKKLSVQTKDKDESKFKIDVFKDVMEKMDEHSKIIIFSDFPCVFKSIESYFKSKQIKFVSLDGGSIPEIDKSVHAYKNGDSKVLLADSSMYGCGMNFENTTDVIFIHRLNPEMEKQVIGRAQRPGRTSILRIHRLLHFNETV